MKYAHYDNTNGRLIGWYDSEIHASIPTPNIEVEDSVWQNAINNNVNFVDINTKTFSVVDFFTDAEKLESFRGTRDYTLSSIDKYQGVLMYADLTAEQQQELINYRLALLDATISMELPTKPSWIE